MRNVISQLRARAYKQRVAELEAVLKAQHHSWSKDYPGGVHLTSIPLHEVTEARLHTAQRLGFALVGRQEGAELRVFAVKYPAT